MNKSKIIAIIAIIIGVVGLAIGFATFSSTLTISSSANVNPTNTFSVVFSTQEDATSSTLGTSNYALTGATLTDTQKNNISISGTTVSGLSATFTEPGQFAIFTFWARNVGEYVAYLDKINLIAPSGSSTFKKCTAGTGATAGLVTAACNDITFSVSAGTGGYVSESTALGTTDVDTNNSLAIGSAMEIIVTISYPTGSDRSDGPFTVEFGSVELVYSTVNT